MLTTLWNRLCARAFRSHCQGTILAANFCESDAQVVALPVWRGVEGFGSGIGTNNPFLACPRACAKDVCETHRAVRPARTRVQTLKKDSADQVRVNVQRPLGRALGRFARRGPSDRASVTRV